MYVRKQGHNPGCGETWDATFNVGGPHAFPGRLCGEIDTFVGTSRELYDSILTSEYGKLSDKVELCPLPFV
jgi:hypothetical protein